jgi:apolipoprotein N-acyltransferase
MTGLAGRIILAHGWKRAALAVFAGAFAVLALPPFDFFAAAFVSFTVLVLLIEGAVAPPNAGPLRRLMPAVKIGWQFGFGYFLAGLWWLGNALLVEADEFAWAIPLAVLVLPAGLALFYALAAGLARVIWTEGVGAIAALAFGFGAAEWLRGFLFTGFPWNPTGHLAMPAPLLMQSASLVGVDGMNALAVLFFALPAVLFLGRHRKRGIFLFLLLAAAHGGFGYYRLNNAAPQKQDGMLVRLVQPSVSQSEKWDGAARDRIFSKLLELSAAKPADGKKRPDLITWPETSIPFLLTERPDAYSAIAAALEDGQTLLAGAVRQEGNRKSGEEVRYYNSLLVINDKGELISASDKKHLVPFGEYLPLDSIFRSLGLSEVVNTPGGFSAGGVRRNITLANGIRLNPLICYEVIFPDEISAEDGRADAMVNVTNDAWYGRTPGPWQHLRFAQIRAAEQGLPLLRAANNGMSATIDSYGQIVQGLRLDEIATIDTYLPAKLQPTWFVLHGRMSFSAILLALAAIAGLTILRVRSRISASLIS